MMMKIPNCKCFPLGIRIQEEYQYVEEDMSRGGAPYYDYDWKDISEINFCPKCGKEYVNDKL